MKKINYALCVGVGFFGIYSALLGLDDEGFARIGVGLLSLDPSIAMSSEPSVSIRLRDMQDSSRADINLRIPERYVKFGEAAEAVTVTGPLAFYLTYPDMRGGREKQNIDVSHCVGLCHGLTQVTLYNSSIFKDEIKIRTEAYVRNKEKYKLIRSGKFSKIYEEYDVMWRQVPFNVWYPDSSRNERRPSVTKNSPPISLHSVPPPGYVAEETYNSYLKHPWPAAHIFVFRKQKGRLVIVECKGNISKPNDAMCEYFGESSKLINLKFRLSFKYILMKNWPLFLNDISQLIDGFIVH